MSRQDELINIIKEMLLLFAILACVGSLYHAKFLAGFGYFGIAAVLYHETTIRRWFRKYFSA